MKKRSDRTVKLCLEELENRLTPSVTVANAANGAVMITGDDANNSIQVQANAGSVNVQGVNGTKVDTAGFDPTKFNGDVIIKMGKGDDQVEMDNSFLPNSQVKIDMGDGNNMASIHDLNANQINVTGGGGNDTVEIFNAGFVNALVNSGAGDDTVNIDNDGGTNVTVAGGDGNDTVEFSNDGIGTANLDGGDGDDTLDVDFSNVNIGSLNETNFEHHPGQGQG